MEAPFQRFCNRLNSAAALHRTGTQASATRSCQLLVTTCWCQMHQLGSKCHTMTCSPMALLSAASLSVWRSFECKSAISIDNACTRAIVALQSLPHKQAGAARPSALTMHALCKDRFAVATVICTRQAGLQLPSTPSCAPDSLLQRRSNAQSVRLLDCVRARC